MWKSYSQGLERDPTIDAPNTQLRCCECGYVSTKDSAGLQSSGTTDEPNVEKDDIALDVPANDLVHIGTDTLGRNHYYDGQRSRILVVDAEHDEYTRGAMVWRRLVVGAANVEHIQTDGPTDDLETYIQFIAEEVDDREWDGETVELIDLNALLGGGLTKGA